MCYGMIIVDGHRPFEWYVTNLIVSNYIQIQWLLTSAPAFT